MAIGQLDNVECVQWRAQTYYDSCLFSTDVPAPPTEREVAGLNLSVFDQEMNARWPPDSVQVGETASKVELDSAGGAKMANSFLLDEGFPPIPAMLVAMQDIVEMAELLG